MPAPPTAVVAVIALLGGAAAGAGLERAGVLSPLAEPEAAVVRADRVAVLDCPEGSVLTSLGRGDRVLATGVSDDGDFVEIRSPLDLEARAWLPIGVVSGDDGEGALADLPVRECDERAGPTTSTSSTTTSSSTSTSTSTTLLEETTTTQPPPEETTTLPPTTRPTTTLGDRTPPSLSRPTASPDPIFDQGNACPSQLPTTSLVGVVVTDDRPGVVVTMTFSVLTSQGPLSGPLNNQGQQGNNFSGTLGPFAPGTAPDPFATVTIVVTATDAAGNETRGQTTVELRPCR